MEECREGRVRSVNTSRRKGGRKTPCAGGAAIEANRGVAGDAVADPDPGALNGAL